MPVINLLPKKEKSTYHSETENRELRKQLYNTTKWRKCRKAHLVKEPLCQQCLREGKVNAGTKDSPLQVHHKKSPFINGQIDWELALDDSNLETICGYHHALEHNKGQLSPADLLKALEDLFNED